MIPARHKTVVGALFDSPGKALPFLCIVLLFLADLVFLQHGRLGSEEGVSIRQLLFVTLMLTGLTRLFDFLTDHRLPLLVVILLGGVVPFVWGGVGILMSNAPSLVFADANGHLFYLALVPLLLGYSRQYEPLYLVNTLAWLILLLCLLSLSAYLFALADIANARAIEVFLREGDYGFFNVFTHGQPYRIYLKSFVFLPIAIAFSILVIVEALREGRPVPRLWVATLILSTLVVIIAQTRSIWLATLVAVSLVLFIVVQRTLYRLLLVIAGSGALALAVSFGPDILRLNDSDGNIGIRMLQVRGLIEAFLDHPVFGAGFGSVIDLSGSGARYSYEMDLLNLLRKVGLVGVGVYTLALGVMLWDVLRHNGAWGTSVEGRLVPVTLTVVLTMSFFNPYFTASLGIGAIAVTYATFRFRVVSDTSGTSESDACDLAMTDRT